MGTYEVNLQFRNYIRGHIMKKTLYIISLINSTFIILYFIFCSGFINVPLISMAFSMIGWGYFFLLMWPIYIILLVVFIVSIINDIKNRRMKPKITLKYVGLFVLNLSCFLCSYHLHCWIRTIHV